MAAEADLSQLAVHRDDRPGSLVRTRAQVFTRFAIPGLLLLGFCGLAAWSAQDVMFPPREVTVVPVHASHGQGRRAGTPLFKAAGWMEPRPTPIQVAALAPGVVEKLLVVEDQAVGAGEPIAQLVAEDAQLALRRAAAEVRLRKAEVAEAQAALDAALVRLEQPVHLEAALGEAEAALAQVETQLKNLPFEIRQAEAQLDYAQRNYDGKVASQGAISARAIEEARAALASAKALLEGLKRRTESLTREREAFAVRRNALQTALQLKADEMKAKDEAEARLSAAQARVQQAEVAVAEAELRLERMTVRAPVDGRILRLVANPGARLMDGPGRGDAADASTVVTMYRPDQLQVRADVRFEDIPKVTLNQPVQIESPALSKPVEGKVLFIGSEANIQKNTLEVKVAIDSPPAVFRPEMLVDATFLAPADPNQESGPREELRLYVPQSLVQQGEGGPFLWLADQSEGVARKQSIETGVVSSEGLIEVTKGLTISSRVIADGPQDLDDGDRIRVTGEAPTSGAASSFTMIPGQRLEPGSPPRGDRQ
jgi:RND family efflux transporter MFP subunit